MKTAALKRILNGMLGLGTGRLNVVKTKLQCIHSAVIPNNGVRRLGVGHWVGWSREGLTAGARTARAPPAWRLCSESPPRNARRVGRRLFNQPCYHFTDRIENWLQVWVWVGAGMDRLLFSALPKAGEPHIALDPLELGDWQSLSFDYWVIEAVLNCVKLSTSLCCTL